MSAAVFSLLSVAAAEVAGIARFELSREPPVEHFSRLVRRSDNISVDLQNKLNQFTTELQIGSNKQSVRVIVDTGSADLWVMDASNPLCSSISSDDSDVDSSSPNSQGDIVCSSKAIFNSSASSSWKRNSTSFHISYKDTTFANGTYGQDTVSYGGVTVDAANFAVANKTDISTGVWGIGLIGTETIVTTLNQDGSFSPTYSNLPLQMKEQGIVGQNAYSLWLNDLYADSGELLFGGVDHAKYSGTLQTVPLVPGYDNAKPNTLQIMLNGISIYQGSKISQVTSFALPALLDSGSTMMVMPSALLDPVAQSIGAVYSSRLGYVGPCGLSGGLAFNFSGAVINVPFSEISFPLGHDSLCTLGFLPSDDSYFILGDTFLRSAYVVYDLDNLEISLANTNYNVTSASLEAISGSVPGATRAPAYSNTSPASTFSTTVLTNFQTGKVTGSLSTSAFPSGTISSEQESSSIARSSGGSAATATSSSSSSKGKKNAAAGRTNSFAMVAATVVSISGVLALTLLV